MVVRGVGAQRVGPGCGNSAAFRSPRAKASSIQRLNSSTYGTGSRAPPKNSARLCVMLPEPTTSTPWLQAAQGSAQRIHLCRACAHGQFPPAPRAHRFAGASASSAPRHHGQGRAASPCAAMPAAPSNSSTSDANAGEPGAGYCSWYSAGGKPPKSCHVAGCALPSPGGIAPSSGATSPPRRAGRNCAFSSWPQRVSAGPVSPASSANKGGTVRHEQCGHGCGKRGRKSGRMRGHGTPLVSIRTVKEIVPPKKPPNKDGLFRLCCESTLFVAPSGGSRRAVSLAKLNPRRAPARAAFGLAPLALPPGGAAARRTWAWWAAHAGGAATG